MPRYKITTVETTTYVYYGEFKNKDDACETFEPEHGGKEIDHDFEVVMIEEIEE